MHLRSDDDALTPRPPELVATASLGAKQTAVQRAKEVYLTSHGLTLLCGCPTDYAAVGAGGPVGGRTRQADTADQREQDRRADDRFRAKAPTAPMHDSDPARARIH
jgi:hypothetical protein